MSYYIEVDGQPECCSGMGHKMVQLLLCGANLGNKEKEDEFIRFEEVAGSCAYETQPEAAAAVDCIMRYAERIGVRAVRVVEGTCPEYADVMGIDEEEDWSA